MPTQRAAFGRTLRSRDTVAWRVRVWDAGNRPSDWSQPATWSVGLLQQSDWGTARWIDYPDRTENQPLPIFARQFSVPRGKKVADARLYLSGVGLHHATVNGREVTDEVLAPGNSNYQLSTEYRTYDVGKALRDGANTIGVELGNGTAYVRRERDQPRGGPDVAVLVVAEPAQGQRAARRRRPRRRHDRATSTASRATTSAAPSTSTPGAAATASSPGSSPRSAPPARTAPASPSRPALAAAHAAGAKVTGSGNNIAASDPSAGAAVTPRFIGRLESHATATAAVARSSPTGRGATAFGPLVTDAWYSGADYDARREQPGWNEAGSDLGPTARRRDGTATEWVSAGIAPPPNLATRLVGPCRRTGRGAGAVQAGLGDEPRAGHLGVRLRPEHRRLARARPAPGCRPGTTVKMAPAESLNPDGTVNQSSLGPGGRGNDLFNTYTAYGARKSESWHPQFNYFGMQWVQVTGLPEGYVPTRDLVTGVRLQADTPIASEFTTSNARINRIHTMARYSFAGNMMSVFTDCPGREKLSYPADYTMPMGSIHRDFELGAFMRTSMHHLVEGQSVADTPMAGNVALKTPVYDWGYTGRFGDEINWGNAIILVPAFLYELYGDTQTMATYYDQMTKFVDYIQRREGRHRRQRPHRRRRADRLGVGRGHLRPDHRHLGLLHDDQQDGDDGRAYRAHRRRGGVHGAGRADQGRVQPGVLQRHGRLLHRHRKRRHRRRDPDGAGVGARRRARARRQATGRPRLPRREHLRVPPRTATARISAAAPSGWRPRAQPGRRRTATTCSGTCSRRTTTRATGTSWQSTPENPGGFTTIGERWTRGSSKNHMILAQIEEWFQSGVAGIRSAPGAVAYDKLVYPAEAGRRPHLRQGQLQDAQGLRPQRVDEVRPAVRTEGDRADQHARRRYGCPPGTVSPSARRPGPAWTGSTAATPSSPFLPDSSRSRPPDGRDALGGRLPVRSWTGPHRQPSRVSPPVVVLRCVGLLQLGDLGRR